MGLWQDWQAAQTGADRQAVIARAFEAAGLVVGTSWTTANGTFTGTIMDGPRATFSHGDGATVLLTGSVAIVRNSTGLDVTPANLNPIQWALAPQSFLVADPAGTITFAGQTWSAPTAAQLRQMFLALVKEAVRAAAGIA